MKITRIYLKNLNSLRGEYDINFESEPFCSAGIFAITGPTGAGKSTILDAITLALYGRAARYGYDRKSTPENMMSRGTGECQADVEFEVPQGRFKASWLLNRSRRKPEGNLQHPQRFVYDSQGKPLAQNITEADKLIEELTGLDVDRFFRSVLLAQGDFVKFLKATPDDRAKLLESLTGTEIYSEISIRAHKETTKRKTALMLREKDLENTKLLSEEELATQKTLISEYTCEIETNTLKLSKQADLITKGTNLDKYLRDQTLLNEQLQTIRKEREEFEPDCNRLYVFRKGASFFPELNTLDQMSKRYNDKKNDVENAENTVATSKCDLRAGIDATSEMIAKQIPSIEQELSAASTARQEKCKELVSRTRWLEEHAQDQSLDVNLSHIIQEITSLMHERNHAKEILCNYTNLIKRLEDAEKYINKYNNEKQTASSRLEEIGREIQVLETTRLELLQNKTEEQLDQEITSLNKYLSYLDKKKETLKALKAIEKELDEYNGTIQQLTINNTKAQTARADAENTLKLELEKLKLLTEKRDTARLIASLQDHREKLEHGKSCPLCGSLDHPYFGALEGSVIVISDLEKELKELEESTTKQNEELKKLIDVSATAKRDLENKKEEHSKTTVRAETSRATLKTLVSEEGQPQEQIFESHPDIENNKSTTIELILKTKALVSSITTNRQKLNDLQKALSVAQHSIDLINQKIKSEQEKIQATTLAINDNKANNKERQVKISKLESALHPYLKPYNLEVPPCAEEKNLLDTLKQRKTTYQEHLTISTDLKNELSTLSNTTRDLDLKVKNLTSENNKLKQFLESRKLQNVNYTTQKKNTFLAGWNTIDEAQEGIKRLDETLIKAQSVLDKDKKDLSDVQVIYSKAKATLSETLIASEFKTIEGLRAAQLSPNEVERIRTKEEDIKGQFNTVRGKLSQVEGDIATLTKDNVPQGDLLLEIQLQRTELAKNTDNVREQLAISKNTLKENEKNHILYAAIFKELEVDRKTLSIWQKICGLIGSSDGTVFRKFAQGLSLDLLLKHANKHLTQLSNRYRLKRTSDDLLDLEIQDLHQANATRPTASLSGGESFLTSLALALGLSDLAGKNVKIDSLFIDEGFGSLDPETLEVAVQALESLRSKNKTIGVISHIELLKERIPTQIMIEKGAGGVSTVSFSA